MAAPRKYHSDEERLAARAAWQRAYRAAVPLTTAQKKRKRAQSKAREQTPKYKAGAAAKYQARMERQAGRERQQMCECCGEIPGGVGRRATMNYEHCHERGTFRGWVCNPCNLVLGHALDRPDLLRKLADYLERT